MTVIPLGPGLPRGSSHLPADLSEPLMARPSCTRRIRLFGVAPGGGCRVSPLGRRTRGRVRTPRTRTRLCGPVPRLRRRQARDWYVRPLAVTLLCGARTFLSAPCGAQRPSGRLHARILAFDGPRAAHICGHRHGPGADTTCSCPCAAALGLVSAAPARAPAVVRAYAPARRGTAACLRNSAPTRSPASNRARRG
jgi:hypothetical protein